MSKDNIYDVLEYWDGELYTQRPDKTRINDDGNFEAIWFHTAKDDAGRKHLGELTIVEFRPESFHFGVWLDILVHYEGSEMPEDEDGNPYYTRYGEEYVLEEVEFDRRAVLQFLWDLLSGRIKRESRPVEDTWWLGYFWTEAPGTVAGRANFPRKPRELARWIASMGYEYVRNWGPGYEYEAYPPLTLRELQALKK